MASTPSRTVRQPRASAISRLHFLSSLLGVPIKYRRPVSCSHATFSALDIPRSITQTRSAIPKRASIASTISSTVVTSVLHFQDGRWT